MCYNSPSNTTKHKKKRNSFNENIQGGTSTHSKNVKFNKTALAEVAALTTIAGVGLFLNKAHAARAETVVPKEAQVVVDQPQAAKAEQTALAQPAITHKTSSALVQPASAPASTRSSLEAQPASTRKASSSAPASTQSLALASTHKASSSPATLSVTPKAEVLPKEAEVLPKEAEVLPETVEAQLQTKAVVPETVVQEAQVPTKAEAEVTEEDAQPDEIQTVLDLGLAKFYDESLKVLDNTNSPHDNSSRNQQVLKCSKLLLLIDGFISNKVSPLPTYDDNKIKQQMQNIVLTLQQNEIDNCFIGIMPQIKTKYPDVEDAKYNALKEDLVCGKLLVFVKKLITEQNTDEVKAELLNQIQQMVLSLPSTEFNKCFEVISQIPNLQNKANALKAQLLHQPDETEGTWVEDTEETDENEDLKPCSPLFFLLLKFLNNNQDIKTIKISSQMQELAYTLKSKNVIDKCFDHILQMSACDNRFEIFELFKNEMQTDEESKEQSTGIQGGKQFGEEEIKPGEELTILQNFTTLQNCELIPIKINDIKSRLILGNNVIDKQNELTQRNLFNIYQRLTTNEQNNYELLLESASLCIYVDDYIIGLQTNNTQEEKQLNYNKIKELLKTINLKTQLQDYTYKILLFYDVLKQPPLNQKVKNELNAFVNTLEIEVVQEAQEAYNIKTMVQADIESKTQEIQTKRIAEAVEHAQARQIAEKATTAKTEAETKAKTVKTAKAAAIIQNQEKSRTAHRIAYENEQQEKAAKEAEEQKQAATVAAQQAATAASQQAATVAAQQAATAAAQQAATAASQQAATVAAQQAATAASQQAAKEAEERYVRNIGRPNTGIRRRKQGQR